jgi:serine/threonine-protein kinase RsbW
MDRHNAQNHADPPDPSDARGKNAHHSLDFTIPSDFIAARDVQRQVMAAVARSGFNDDSTFAVRIALEEGLVNAIKHGNRGDPGKKVRVEATITRERAEITIEDEGPGFDRAGVPDPTCDENICRPSGRGILLIESYMNAVRWDRGGRRIRMMKRNEPGTLPRS